MIPRSPVSTTSSEDESYGDCCPTPTPSNEGDASPRSSNVKGKVKKSDRRVSNQAWSSPFLEQQMAKRPILQHSVTPIHLEAVGVHFKKHRKPQNQSSDRSQGDSGRYQVVVPNFLFQLVTVYFNFHGNIKMTNYMASPIITSLERPHHSASYHSHLSCSFTVTFITHALVDAVQFDESGTDLLSASC